ncbi:MAG: hypothetical protein ACKPKO_20285 [Candidatus Fonsibacter sp.]
MLNLNKVGRPHRQDRRRNIQRNDRQRIGPLREQRRRRQRPERLQFRSLDNSR